MIKAKFNWNYINKITKLSELAKPEKNIHRAHSIDEAENTHKVKVRKQDDSMR